MIGQNRRTKAKHGRATTKVARDFFTKERRGSENSGGGVIGVVVFVADYAKAIGAREGGGVKSIFTFFTII